MSEQEQKIDKLKEYFTQRGDVVMAFLFGSQAKGLSGNQSDWDIGVYVTPETTPFEWEETNREYAAEDLIWGDLTRILETDKVDLLILNRAPATIADTVLRGVPLTVKDWTLWLRFSRIVSGIAEEYREFVHSFYQVFERSRSLNPYDREDLERTLAFLGEQMQLYSVYREFTQSVFEGEPRKRNEIERWLENIMNAVIDCAKIVLGSRKRTIPSTYRETVRRVVHELKLPDEYAVKFEAWVQFRNVLAHEYLDIKWKRLEEFARTSQPYIGKLSESVRHFLEE